MCRYSREGQACLRVHKPEGIFPSSRGPRSAGVQLSITKLLPRGWCGLFERCGNSHSADEETEAQPVESVAQSPTV